MDQLRKQSALSTRFAVNRDYQPARIERELLAQVFDLVKQNGLRVFSPGDGRHQPAITAASDGSQDLLASSSGITNDSPEVNELEEVA